METFKVISNTVQSIFINDHYENIFNHYIEGDCAIVCSMCKEMEKIIQQGTALMLITFIQDYENSYAGTNVTGVMSGIMNVKQALKIISTVPYIPAKQSELDSQCIRRDRVGDFDISMKFLYELQSHFPKLDLLESPLCSEISLFSGCYVPLLLNAGPTVPTLIAYYNTVHKGVSTPVVPCHNITPQLSEIYLLTCCIFCGLVSVFPAATLDLLSDSIVNLILLNQQRRNRRNGNQGGCAYLGK